GIPIVACTLICRLSRCRPIVEVDAHACLPTIRPDVGVRMATARSLPVVRDAPPRDVEGAIERAIADVPSPQTQQVTDPDRQAEAIAKKAAKHAALLSGSLALPPGPFGMLTVLPDLYLIWKTQRQMVADIFALYGRTAGLTRTHMLYCLFRHAASQVLRDVVVRTGQRVVVSQLSGGVLRTVVAKVGVSVSRRVAGN